MTVNTKVEASAAPSCLIHDKPEVWGGVEYTCNRVHDRYFDQMEFSGHASRSSDYEGFRDIGIRTLRVGLLWERHDVDPSWRWFDERLALLRQLGIKPIASLIHHGSGPKHTSLLDSAFPEKLASYATAVAERYPWIDSYTPVNEPNTTARFSAMYGLWYPHESSRRSYLQALLNQLKGTVLSMQAIRRIQPDARLVQTDDIGQFSGTEVLRSTRELLNLRQWLPFDLLSGRVDAAHPMYAYMAAEGISEADIHWFTEHPCPPSVIGVNYYVTSDRYLDHRVNLYPSNRRSAEGHFVDIEAVRISPGGITGVQLLLESAWNRYRTPVAITEVHLGGDVAEQIRWFAESWAGAMEARRKGVPCVALTAWALLGSFYWNDLVTNENGHYEPGVFDIRSGVLIPTQLATVVAQAANGKSPHHPFLEQKGWWHHRDRLSFTALQESSSLLSDINDAASSTHAMLCP